MCIKPRNINFDPYFCPTMSTLSCVSSTDSSFPPSPPLSPSPSTFDSHSVSSASSPSSSPSHLSSPSPRQYILPSSHFANKKFLHGLSETLGKGAGDLLFLCVPRVDAPITKLALALKEVAKSIGCEIAESWMQIITVVKGKSLCCVFLWFKFVPVLDLSVPYYVSNRDERNCLGLDDIFCAGHSTYGQGSTEVSL